MERFRSPLRSRLFVALVGLVLIVAVSACSTAAPASPTAAPAAPTSAPAAPTTAPAVPTTAPTVAPQAQAAPTALPANYNPTIKYQTDVMVKNPKPVPAGKTLKIGIAYQAQTAAVTIQANAAKAVADKNNAEVIVQYAAANVAKQAEQLRTLVNQGVDAIIVGLVGGVAGLPVAAEVAGRGIPILLDSAFVDKPEYFFGYVGPNHYAMCFQEAQMMAKAVGNKGNVLNLQGMAGSLITTSCSAAFADAAKGTDIKIIDSANTSFQRKEGHDVTADTLTRYSGQLAAVVSPAHDLAAGAAEAVKGAGLPAGQVKVYAIATNKDHIDLIRSGFLTGTIWQDYAEEGTLAMERTLKYLRGESIPRDTILTMAPITKDNIEQWAPKMGNW